MGNEQSQADMVAVSGDFVPNHFQRTREFSKSTLAAHIRALKSNAVPRNAKDVTPAPAVPAPLAGDDEKRMQTPYLAEELFLLVCSFIDDPKTLCNLARVCRTYRRITGDAMLWRKMNREHWGDTESVLASSRAGWKSVFGARYKCMRSWRTARNQVSTLLGHAGSVTCLQFDKSRLISGDDEGCLQVWDLQTGQKLHPFHGHSGPVWSLRYNDDIVVSGSYDRTVKVWDQATWAPVHTLRGHDGWVSSVALYRSDAIVSGSWDETVRVWDITTGRCSAHIVPGFGSVYALHMDNASPSLACAAHDRALLYDLERGSCITTLRGHTAAVYGVQQWRSLVVTCSDDKTVRMWDARTSRSVAELRGHRSGVMCVQMDDVKIASGSYDRRINIWDTRKISSGSGNAAEQTAPPAETHPAFMYSLFGHGEPVFCLQFSEQLLVSGSGDHTVKIFDFTNARHCMDDTESLSLQGESEWRRRMQRVVSG